jgi:Cupin-like domain
MLLRPVPGVLWSEFQPSRLGGEPRVVMDDVQRWEKICGWTPEYLKACIGHRDVPVRETNGPPTNIFQNLTQGGRISFGEYLDWVIESARYIITGVRAYGSVSDVARAVSRSGLECSYYLDAKLGELSPVLLAEAGYPDWYRCEPVDINFWCGVLGTSSGLHCDVTPNCNVQVVGRKHFILFPPSQGRRIYQVPGITHCRFDPNLPDFEQFPRAKCAVGQQCTLEPGQSLYIPVGWFHQVTVVSDWAVNVNFFWARPFPQGLVIPALWRFLLRRGWARMHVAMRQRRMPGGSVTPLTHA